jgi:hypothetical protein
MEPLGDLERAVLEMMAEGDAPEMRKLQEQLAGCVVRSRELTGVGFFTSLEVDRASVAPVERLPTPFGDVYAEIEGLAHGAGFLLWIKDGYVDTLEGHSYDEPWPDVIGAFTLLPWSQFEGKSATPPAADD